MDEPDNTRYPPQAGLLGARLNAARLVEALDALALQADEESDEREHFADLHGLAIDVWQFLGTLIDERLAADDTGDE